MTATRRSTYKGFTIEVRPSRFAGMFSGFATTRTATLNYVGAATPAEARKGIKAVVDRYAALSEEMVAVVTDQCNARGAAASPANGRRREQAFNAASDARQAFVAAHQQSA
jgi:hypothetical protein